MNMDLVQVMQMTEMTQLTVKQLKTLLEPCNDDHKIRVWTEMRNDNDEVYLEGRKLCGVVDEDDSCCLCAMLYKEGESHR